MTYKEARAYLDDLCDSGIKLRLAHIKRCLKLLGNPHQSLKVIQVGGTNGKGSTAAFIASILQSAAYKVGLYISPHLIDFRERLTINGRQISKKELAELATELKPHILKVSADPRLGSLTFFEVITIMALHYFAREKVDFAILEVGLGGRLDATNVVKSLVSVITNSDYDHMDRLGKSLASIAREQAGIIKRRGLVISAAQGRALALIKKICRERQARAYYLDKDIKYQALESNLDGQSFNMQGVFSKFENLRVTLLGRHQLLNACCSIAAVEVLQLHRIFISSEAIKKGLLKTRWPGRLEIVRRFPLVIVDGAHNHPAAKQLRASLEDLLGEKKRLILVLGICEDKEIRKIIKELVPLASQVVVTAAAAPRAARPEDLYRVAIRYNEHVRVVKGVEEAVKAVLGKARKDELICASGSLYVAGEAKKFFSRAS